MAKSFDLDKQYRLYKIRVGYKNLTKIQDQELKRAFVGAIGQFQVWILKDMYKMTEKRAIHELNVVMVNVAKFWKEEEMKG